MKTSSKQKRGFAVLSVLFLIAALTLMLGMLMLMGGQRAYTARRLINETKAMVYAEAGIDYAYSILSVDFEQRNNPEAFELIEGGTQTASTGWQSNGDGTYMLKLAQYGDGTTETPTSGTTSSYRDGSFTLTLTPIGNKYVLINSVGVCEGATRIAEVLIDDENAYDSGPFPDYSNMEGFNYAVLSGGVYNFGGCGNVTGAKLHSNNTIQIRGSAGSDVDISSSVKITTSKVTVEGSLTAPELKTHAQADITEGATQASVPPVEIPDIDLTPYFNWAKRHGEVYNGFSTSVSYTPAGGVLWVEGDVYIDSHAVISGSIIATGNIYISGDVDIDPTTTTFAMASRDGNIYNTSSGTLNGLIYAKTGDYSQTANGVLNGQLIVNGNIKKGGNSDIINYVRSVPTDPAGDTAPTSAWPVISAWQR